MCGRVVTPGAVLGGGIAHACAAPVAPSLIVLVDPASSRRARSADRRRGGQPPVRPPRRCSSLVCAPVRALSVERLAGCAPASSRPALTGRGALRGSRPCSSPLRYTRSGRGSLLLVGFGLAVVAAPPRTVSAVCRRPLRFGSTWWRRVLRRSCLSPTPPRRRHPAAAGPPPRGGLRPGWGRLLMAGSGPAGLRVAALRAFHRYLSLRR